MINVQNSQIAVQKTSGRVHLCSACMRVKLFFAIKVHLLRTALKYRPPGGQPSSVFRQSSFGSSTAAKDSYSAGVGGHEPCN